MDAVIIFISVLLTPCTADTKRPFYNIAHMVNSIEQVTYYLDRNANVLESDVTFHSNGSIKELYHGIPCDCFRTCFRTAPLPDFLEHVREITDPMIVGNYSDRMVLQYFDLKLSTSGNLSISGQEIAQHILDYLWTKDKSRKQEVRALIFIDSVDHRDAISGFLEEFKSRGEEARLKDVGFDGGTGDLEDIQRMFESINVKGNIWQGDGITNCLSPLHPVGRLKQAITLRDSPSSFISIVYHWTIDLKIMLRKSLNLGVDGIMTNNPEGLYEVLQESDFQNDFRLATLQDDPFGRFEKAQYYRIFFH